MNNFFLYSGLDNLYSNLSETTTVLLSLAIILFAGFGVSRLTKLLKLPNVSGYIIAGILIALANDTFAKEYGSSTSFKSLANKLNEAIKEKLEESEIKWEKIENPRFKPPSELSLCRICNAGIHAETGCGHFEKRIGCQCGQNFALSAVSLFFGPV